MAAELEHAARLAGAEGMSFETIVASGERSRRCRMGARLVRSCREEGFVTLDFGVVLDGYLQRYDAHRASGQGASGGAGSV